VHWRHARRAACWNFNNSGKTAGAVVNLHKWILQKISTSHLLNYTDRRSWCFPFWRIQNFTWASAAAASLVKSALNAAANKCLASRARRLWPLDLRRATPDAGRICARSTTRRRTNPLGFISRALWFTRVSSAFDLRFGLWAWICNIGDGILINHSVLIFLIWYQ
jgi:hypothetical protein